MKRKYWITGILWLLFAACQQHTPEVKVTVKNPTGLARIAEMVEVGWEEIEAELGEVDAGKVVVYDAAGQEQTSQVIYRGGESPVGLIFQVTLAPGQKQVYFIRPGQPSAYSPSVHGRLVPERKDDFAWENKLVGYRMYGPALEAGGEISNGIDVWLKNTPELLLEEWYKSGDYHRNHGKGLDCYAVGRTLGGGAMAPWYDGQLVLGNNFVSYRILDQGPLRISFQLNYAPYPVGDRQVTERRLISLDADYYFCRMQEIYTGAPADMEVTAGIVLRNEPGEILQDTLTGVMGYWEPVNRNNGEDNGHTGIGVVFPQGVTKIVEAQGHLLGIIPYTGTPVEYYFGSAWSQGKVKNAEEWFWMIRTESRKRREALELTIDR